MKFLLSATAILMLAGLAGCAGNTVQSNPQAAAQAAQPASSGCPPYRTADTGG